jgi:hypothetical protein
MQDKLDKQINKISEMNRDEYKKLHRKLLVFGWINIALGILCGILWIINLVINGLPELKNTSWVIPFMVGSLMLLLAEKFQIIRRLKVGDDD